MVLLKDVAYQEDFDRTRTKQIPYVKTTIRNYAINIQSINKIIRLGYFRCI